MKTNSTIHDPRHMTIIATLKSARIRKKMTQEELANILGVTRIYVSKTEIGERNLSLIELVDYCTALDIDVYAIIAAIKNEEVPKDKYGNDDFITGFAIGYLKSKGMTPDENPIAAKIISGKGKSLEKKD